MTVHPSVSVITDLEIADQVYNLRKTLDRVIASGKTTRAAGEEWLDEVVRQSEEGSFQCSLTAYMVTGTKLD